MCCQKKIADSGRIQAKNWPILPETAFFVCFSNLKFSYFFQLFLLTHSNLEITLFIATRPLDSNFYRVPSYGVTE